MLRQIARPSPAPPKTLLPGRVNTIEPLEQFIQFRFRHVPELNPESQSRPVLSFLEILILSTPPGLYISGVVKQIAKQLPRAFLIAKDE